MTDMELVNRRINKILRLRQYALKEKHWHKVSQADYILKMLSERLCELLFFNINFNNN